MSAAAPPPSPSPAFDHETYLSPLTWRYGTPAMRRIWSEATKRRMLRAFWVALAQAQQEAGLVTQAQVDDLRVHQNDVDIARAEAIEREIRHDLMAEIRTYAEQCPLGGPIIHLGATSMDALDNVDARRISAALDLLLARLARLLDALAEQIDQHAVLACMAYTHIQPAEPTTVGYRLAQYGEDLRLDFEALRAVRASICGKGLKGAVGTSASYTELLQGTGWSAADLERRTMEIFGVRPFLVATQTYSRRQDLCVANALATLGATLHKLAFDVRLLQTPSIGEVQEHFGAQQVGSSAMPFKRNPISAENIDSLTRQLAALPRIAWDNAALSLLERTLDDSANRRLWLPEAFLLADEVLHRTGALLRGWTYVRPAIARNLRTWGVFAATERVLMAAVKAGADRQLIHEAIREQSMAAWAALQAGQPNPLPALLAADARITQFVPADSLPALLDASSHVGDAAQRAQQVAATLRATAQDLPNSIKRLADAK